MNIFAIIDYQLRNPALIPNFERVMGVDAVSHTNYTSDANCRGTWLFVDNLNDTSADANHLTQTGTVAYSTTVPTGYGASTAKSLSLDGSTNYANRTHANLSTNFPGKKASCTAAAGAVWFKAAVDPNAHTGIISKGWGGEGWEVRTNYSADWQWWIRIVDNTFSDNVAYFFTATDTNWHHIAWSFSATGNLTTWIDGGAGVNTSAATVDQICSGGTTSNLVIGAGNTGANKFNGLIFEPIVFDRTISDAEAAEIYGFGIDGLH